jgi:putative DNA-invertase from lambdoid prophage Rac
MENSQPKKIALYCRVSTNKQVNENQHQKLFQYCKDKGLEFDLFEEVESSKKTRPIKQDLLNKLRDGQYEQVLVYKLDRWARSSRELILEIQELTDKGVGFISLTDNLDFSSSSGRLHFQILAAFSEFERSLISERTREGLARTKNNGTKLGRPKGSKDSKQRPKSGYYIREAKKRMKSSETQGQYKSIETYLK